MTKSNKFSEQEQALLIATIDNLMNGDTAAQGTLVELTQNRLYRFSLYLCGNRELAQDLCQDAYIKVFRSISTLKDPAAFMGWLFRIAKNVFLDRCDSQGRQQVGFKEDLAKSLEAELKEEDLDLAIGVRRVLETLEPEDRLLILSVDLEGLSYSEAAELIGVSEMAVRSRLHRLRDELIKKFKK